MLRILLLGKNGQLGWELNRALLPLGLNLAVGYPQIDLENPDTFVGLIREVKPNLIVNAAAYTAVDAAENAPVRACTINAVAPGVLAEEARRLNAFFVHYSTDYVFDGTAGVPYKEIDAVNPLNIYGQTKLDGERAVQAVGGNHLILRTAWVYSTYRDSFVTKVLQWARKNETLKLVDDQVSNPTWTRVLAGITALVLARGLDFLSDHVGLYHLAGSGAASRFEWAQSILLYDPNSQEQITKTILPAKTSEFPAPAERPLFSALDCSKFYSHFGLSLPFWKISLQLALQELHMAVARDSDEAHLGVPSAALDSYPSAGKID